MNKLLGDGVPLKPEKYVDTFKAHITTPVSPSINTWTAFAGFSKVDSESNGVAIELDPDTSRIIVKKKGLYQFGGCVHYINNTAATFSDLTVLSRLFKNGTTEARCSQRGRVESFARDSEDVLSYNGTDFFEVNDEVVLQYFTNESQLVFDSNSNFQNQVAATFWAIYLGVF